MKRVLFFLGLGLSTSIFFSCGSDTKIDEQIEEQTTARLVSIESLQMYSVQLAETYPATILAGQVAHIAPIQPGQIQRIRVNVGDKVTRGQVLVEMDPTQRNQTRVQYYDAKRDLQRMDSLIAYGTISQQMYDKAKLQYEVLATALQMLEENTFIRAPFDGVITGKYFNDRENFTGMAPQLGVSAIVTLMQIAELKVEVHISERYFPIITPGMEAQLQTNIYPDQLFTGIVKTISPVIDAATKTFMVELHIPNPQQKLRPGMFGRVSINFGSGQVLAVPSHALLKQDGTNTRYIFVYDDGVARRIDVIPGKRYNDIIEISGEELSEGMLLITAGHVALTHGDAVRTSITTNTDSVDVDSIPQL